MSTTLGSQPASGGVRVNGHSPWIWALRRTIVGLLILTVTVGGAAWLLYAAIDPDSEANAEAHAALRKAPGLSQPGATPSIRPAGAIAAR